ncbi:MAG: sulfite exporter TauE/SafE family protein [Acidobacteria bacterium]|nr:sulfite exporter TauE/SafE family protein [Acidobacteriota bacterium]
MDATFLFGVILSGGVGFSLGLLGGGGSIITVPLLVYLFHVSTREAIAVSLGVVGGTSLLGAILHYRRGSVRLKTGLLFGAFGMVGAFLGSRLTNLFSDSALLLLFALLMMVVATFMLSRKGQHGSERETAGSSPAKAAAAGLAVGLLTGFLGVGGGFLIVPALIYFGELNMKDAVGTSLLVIFANCASGLLGHLGQTQVDYRLAGLVTALAMGGACGGTAVAHKIPPRNLRYWFAWFVIAVAVFLIFESWNTLSG